MIYLDANATEPLRPQARAALESALDIVGNPYSVHAAGRAARRIMEYAREAIADRFGARAEDVVFTSGATEADALALHGLGQGRRLIVGATEHDAILAPAGAAARIPVDRDGLADLDALAALLMDGPPALVCLMAANNETGTIQPVARAGEICHRHGALLFIDAVQMAGRLPFSLPGSGAAGMAISSHKLGGPAGVGALILAPAHAAIPGQFAGGGQERGRRGGTPPVPLIAAFAAALLACQNASRLGPLRDALERAVIGHGAVPLAIGAPRLPNTASLALPGVRADAQVIALDLAGVCVSAGAACSSGKVTTSHVLTAMGLGELAGQAIRVSLPWNATETEVNGFATAYASMAASLRPALAPALA